MALSGAMPALVPHLTNGGSTSLDTSASRLAFATKTFGVDNTGLDVSFDGRDALELLGAHDRAHPVVSGHVSAIADDGREADEVLPRRPDTEHAAAPADLRFDRVLGLPGVHAHQVLGIDQPDGAVLDVQPRPSLGRSLDDDPVHPVEPHEGTQEPVGLRSAAHAGAGALGGHREGARTGDPASPPADR